MEDDNKVPLKEYIETRIHDMEEARKAAYISMEKRLGGMNEFRGQIQDQAIKFYTIAAHEAYAKGIDAELRVLHDFKTTIDAKASQNAVVWATIVGASGLLLGVVSLILGFFMR
jgi:hypothetical protein